MSSDKFTVAGVYLEKQIGNLLIQTEYYNASHNGERYAQAILSVIQNANVNAFQQDRFLQTNEDQPNDDLTTDDIRTSVKYNVRTWYTRLGYNIPTKVGQFIPYLLLDWMSHPEAIQSKDFGGDDEAGLADDRIFWEPSAGLVFKPLPNVAIMLDGSVIIFSNTWKKMFPILSCV